MQISLPNYPAGRWTREQIPYPLSAAGLPKYVERLQQHLKSYNKIGKRNSHALEHRKIGKHMMHLIRLFMMGLDILEAGKIRTYRGRGSGGGEIVAEVTEGAYTDEYTLLMDIRSNRFLSEDNQVLPEFYDILAKYEERFEYAKEHTPLPEKPDLERIKRIKIAVNRSIITGEDIQMLRREYGI